MRFVYGRDDEVREFVAKQSGLARPPWQASKTIGLISGSNQLIAGLVYHHWNPEAGTIVLSGAATSARWLNRTVLQRVFDYPFSECGCQMLIAQPRADDLRLLRQLAVVGFSFIKVPRLYGRDHDGVIAMLTDDDWMVSPFNRKRRGIELEEAA